MGGSEAPRSVREQVWGAVDPSGEIRSLVDSGALALRGVAWFPALEEGLAADWRRLATAGVAFGEGVVRIEEAHRVLIPRGWAITQMDVAAIEKAVSLVLEEQGEAADELLASQWDDKGAWRTKRVCDRVRTMGVGDPELRSLFEERGRLLLLAKGHHDAGRYDASVPALHGQMEGIVMEVTEGKKFFTKGRAKADLVDPQKLVSIEAGLAALQAIYGEDVKQTQAAGSLSRHGVAHGRELAYDTRVISAKTWSVFDALVDWALPRARELVGQRRTQRQAENAGSRETDSLGKRIDDREFAETRDMLRLLCNSAMGHHRQRGSFRGDLVGGVYRTDDFTKRGLPRDHRTHQEVRDDGQEVRYWRETVSGWVLGIGLVWENGGFYERFFSAGEPPVGLGADDWSQGVPPDWA